MTLNAYNINGTADKLPPFVNSYTEEYQDRPSNELAQIIPLLEGAIFSGWHSVFFMIPKGSTLPFREIFINFFYYLYLI